MAGRVRAASNDVPPVEQASLHTRWDRRLAAVVIAITLGYLVFSRTFAYVGIPSLNLFVGEALLALLVLAPATRGMYLAAVRALVRPGMWHLLAIAVLLLLLYGLAQAARGHLLGLSTLDALKSLPYNYYPLFLFAGLWLAGTYPGALRSVTLWLAWINGVYGVAYVLVLSSLPWLFPGQDNVPLFGMGYASGLAIIGLLAFHLHRGETPLLLVLNGFALLGLQQRSELVGFTLALLGWCVLSRHLKAFLQASGGVLGLLIALSVLGISIPAAATRGGEISVAGVFGRMVAAVDPSLAARFVPNSEIYANNVSWRTTWWSAIWEQSLSSPVTTVFGNGYGYALRNLVPYVPEDIRTPHNVFFYALGYTGWLGVFFTALLWVVLGRLLWRVYRRTGQPYGIAATLLFFGVGMFGNWFETPFGALPTYVLLGMCLAPLLTRPGTSGGAGLPSRLRAPGAPSPTATGSVGVRGKPRDDDVEPRAAHVVHVRAAPAAVTARRRAGPDRRTATWCRSCPGPSS